MNTFRRGLNNSQANEKTCLADTLFGTNLLNYLIITGSFLHLQNGEGGEEKGREGKRREGKGETKKQLMFT
jgi:hypothetical protein